MEKLKIGIIGLGYVGNSIYNSFKSKGANLWAIYDKFKEGGIGCLEKTLECAIVFIALPTNFSEETKSFDLEPITETCKFFQNNNYNGIIVIKSTLEPNTCENLCSLHNLKIIHNPEFLSAKTAFEDFHNQKHIVLGKTSKINEELEIIFNFYNHYYKNSEISICTSTESEMMKIFLNSFYAVKIQFFNEIFFACRDSNVEYNNVLELMLKNGWINPMHTKVPGTDGKFSYGGMCFPKDTNSLNEFLKRRNLPNKVLEATIKERNDVR